MTTKHFLFTWRVHVGCFVYIRNKKKGARNKKKKQASKQTNKSTIFKQGHSLVS